MTTRPFKSMNSLIQLHVSVDLVRDTHSSGKVRRLTPSVTKSWWVSWLSSTLRMNHSGLSLEMVASTGFLPRPVLKPSASSCFCCFFLFSHC